MTLSQGAYMTPLVQGALFAFSRAPLVNGNG
jgi:hypothetical protein